MGSDRQAHRFAVVSGKGGVGKTVITANVAAALSAMGVRTLVIDADLGLANVDIILGLNPSRSLPELLRGDCTLEQVLLRVPGGFDLLPSGSGLFESTRMTSGTADRMESLLRRLETQYDAILFDAGAGIGEVVTFFSRIAHTILLVATPEPTSVTDAYATLKVLARRYGRKQFSLIVNQADPDNPEETGSAIVNRLQDVISRFLSIATPEPVQLRLAAAIPRDPAVADAISRQQLLLHAAPNAPSARTIAWMATSLLPAAMKPGHAHVIR